MDEQELRNEFRGAYVAWYLDQASSRAVRQWCTRSGVVKPVGEGEHHCTIMYSPERGLDPSCHGDHPLPRPWVGGYPLEMTEGPRRTDVLGPRSGKGALVVMLRSAAMEQRHRWYRDECLLRHSYPEYTPHLTLSYDCDAQDPRVLLDVVRNPIPVPLVFSTEHRDFCKD